MWTLGCPTSFESPSLLPGPKRGAISAVSSSPDGSLLAVLRDSGELQVWSGGPHFLLLGATKTFRSLAIELQGGYSVPNSTSASYHGDGSSANPYSTSTTRASTLASKPAPGPSPVLVWRSDSASIAVLEPPNDGRGYSFDSHDNNVNDGYSSSPRSLSIGLLGVYSVVVRRDQPVLQLPLPGWLEQAADWRGAPPGSGNSGSGGGGGSNSNGSGGRARQTTAPPTVNLTPKVVLVASSAASTAESLAYRDAASHSSVGGSRVKAAAGAARGRWRSCLPGEPTSMCALPLTDAEKRTSNGRGRPHDDASLSAASSNAGEEGLKSGGSSGTRSSGVQLRVLVGTSCGVLCLVDCGPSFGGMAGGSFAVLRVFGSFGQLAAPPPSPSVPSPPPLPLATEAHVSSGLVASASKRMLKDYIAERGSGAAKSPGRARSRSNSTGSLSNSTSGANGLRHSGDSSVLNSSTSTSSSSHPSTTSHSTTSRSSASGNTSTKLGIRALSAAPYSSAAHVNSVARGLLCYVAAVLEDGRCVAAALPIQSNSSMSGSSGCFDSNTASGYLAMRVHPPSIGSASSMSSSINGSIQAWATSVAIAPTAEAGPAEAGCLLAVGWWALSTTRKTPSSSGIETPASSGNTSPSTFASGHGMVTLHRLSASTSTSKSTTPTTATTTSHSSIPEAQSSASFLSKPTWMLAAPVCAPPLCLAGLGWGGPVLPPAGASSAISSITKVAGAATDAESESLRKTLDAKHLHDLSGSSDKSALESSTSLSSSAPDEEGAWADAVAVNPGPPLALTFSPSLSSVDSSSSSSSSSGCGRRTYTLAVAYAHRGFAVWEASISATPLLCSLPEVPPQFLSPAAGAWVEKLSEGIHSPSSSNGNSNLSGSDVSSIDSLSNAWCAQAAALLTMARPAPPQVSSTGGAAAALSYGGVACVTWAGPGGSHLITVPALSSSTTQGDPAAPFLHNRHLQACNNASLVAHDVWRSALGPTGSCETPLLVSANAVAVLDRLPWPSSSPSSISLDSSRGSNDDLRPTYAGVNSVVDATVSINSDSAAVYRWRVVPLPPQYSAAYAPLQCCAVSYSGLHVAVAGLRGLALLSHPTHAKAGLSSSSSSSSSSNTSSTLDNNGSNSRKNGSLSKGGGWSGLSGGTGSATGISKSPHKWRLFGTEQQERALRVINLAWWGDDYLILIVDRSSSLSDDDDTSSNHQSTSSTSPYGSPRNSASSRGSKNTSSGSRHKGLVIEVYSRGQLDASSLMANCPLPRGLQPSFLHIISADTHNVDSCSSEDVDLCNRAILLVSDGFQFAMFRLEPPQKASAGIPSPGLWGASAPSSSSKSSNARVQLAAEGQLPSVQNAASTIYSLGSGPRSHNTSVNTTTANMSRGTNTDMNASEDAPCTAPTKEMRLIWIRNTNKSSPSELRLLVLDADGVLSTSEATALGQYGRRRVVSSGVVSVWPLELHRLLNLPLICGTDRTRFDSDSMITDSSTSGAEVGAKCAGATTGAFLGAFLYLQRTPSKSSKGVLYPFEMGIDAAPFTLRCWLPNLSASLPAIKPTLFTPRKVNTFSTSGLTSSKSRSYSEQISPKVVPPRTPHQSPPSSDSWASEAFGTSPPAATEASLAPPQTLPLMSSLLSLPPRCGAKQSSSHNNPYHWVHATAEATIAAVVKTADPIVGGSTTLLSSVPKIGCLVALEQSVSRTTIPISSGISAYSNSLSIDYQQGNASGSSLIAPPGYEPASEVIPFLDAVLLELLAIAVAEAELDWNTREKMAVTRAATATESEAAGESSSSSAISPGRKQRSASIGSRGSQKNNDDREDTDGSYEASEDETDDAEEVEGFNDTSAFDEDEVEAGAEWADIGWSAQEGSNLLPRAVLPSRALAVFELAALVVQRTARNASTQAALYQSLEKFIVAAASATANAAARAAKLLSAATAAPVAAVVSSDANEITHRDGNLRRTSAVSDAVAALHRLKSVLGAGLGLVWAHAQGCYHEVLARAARQLEPNAALYLFQDFREAISSDHDSISAECEDKDRSKATPLIGAHPFLLPDPRPQGNAARSPVALMRTCIKAGKLRVAAQLLPLAFPEHDSIETTTVDAAHSGTVGSIGEIASSSLLAADWMSALTAGLELLNACFNAGCPVLPLHEDAFRHDLLAQIASPAGFVYAGKWDPELIAEIWAFLDRMQSDRYRRSENQCSNGNDNNKHDDSKDHNDIPFNNNCGGDGTLASSDAVTFGRSLVDNGDGALVFSHSPIIDNEEQCIKSGNNDRVETSAQVLTLFVLRRLSAGHVDTVLRHFSRNASPVQVGSSTSCGFLIPCGWAIAWRAPVRQRLVFAFTCLEDTFGFTRVTTAAATGTATSTAAEVPFSISDHEDSDARLKLAPGTVRELLKLLQVATACRLDAWSVAAATLLRDRSAVQRALSSPWSLFGGSHISGADLGGLALASVHAVTAADYEAVVEVLTAELTGTHWGATLRWAAETARDMWEDDMST